MNGRLRMALVGSSPRRKGLSGMGPVGRQIRVPKSAELVAAQLRRQIIKGELVEGEALAPESALLEPSSVSRGPRFAKPSACSRPKGYQRTARRPWRSTRSPAE